MTIGGVEGLSSPANVTPEFEHWFAQVLAELQKLATTTAPSYSDSTRPDPGNPGRIIFNTDDGELNVDDGTNWILVSSGATT